MRQNRRRRLAIGSAFTLLGAICLLSCWYILKKDPQLTQHFLPVSATGSRAYSNLVSESNPWVSRALAGKKANINLRALTSSLPLSFEPNRGQVAPEVMFLSRSRGYTLFLTATEAILSLPNSDTHGIERASASLDNRRFASPYSQSSLIKLRLENADDTATVQAVDQLPGRHNYLIGNNPGKWQTDVPTFRRILFEEIYPGIDLTYYGNQRQLEYDFTVAPGSKPETIRFAVNREVNLRISKEGDLVLSTFTGEVREPKPRFYQEIEGDCRPVQGRYVLLGKHQFGFEIGEYDTSSTLIIDPTLVYSSYLGGNGDDSGSSIAVDSTNNVYIAGTTSSTTFPVRNPAFPMNAGLSDIFVTKIDAAGANIVYSTYVGGAGLDRGDGIAVDTVGNAYVVGRVDSSSVNFPTTPGALAVTYRGGDFDGVVFKLNAQGNGLVYSTYLGGEENDSTEGIAVDSGGNAYVTGGSRSLGFPVTTTAYQGANSGDTDAYLAKINSAGSALLYSTLLGGGGTDRGSGVAVDSSGNAFVVGFTSSADFPTQNAFQNFSGGSFDAFVAKINTNASGVGSLALCSYLGGIADEKAYGIALDSGANNVYVVGQTSSNDFPLLNPAQPAYGGSFDGFIAKITSAGTRVYATYLGGSGDDRATGIAVNSLGEAYVTGFTSSTNFPTVNPIQSARAGGADAFIAKLNSVGSAFLYATYLGGSANENSVSTVTSTNPIALDSSSNAYITGYTASGNFPTVSPIQPANAGGASDVFFAKISDTNPPADFSLSVNPLVRAVTPGGSTTFDLAITPLGGFTGNVALSVAGLSSDARASFNPASVTITDANARTSVLTVTTTASTPSGTYVLNITAASGNIQHSTQVSLVVSGAASANLLVAKSASPNPAIVGANLTYRIVVTNNGPSPATNITATDTLPGGLNFVSATATQGTCSGTTSITCSLGNVASGSFATVSIIVVPQSTGQLSNTASAIATESDPDISDNTSAITTNVTSQSSGPSMLDPSLAVRTVVTGLSQPTSMAFIGTNDFLILEKDTGRVRRVVNGVIQGTVLDLAVNSASERGLLGIAPHPNFNLNGFVYLFWTESSTGSDSTNLADVATLGNRIDRYTWNGSTLTFDRNLIHLRAYQADANQPLRGNHNGGVLRFGLDGKLYILMGDNGRRGFMQNNTMGPSPDDQFGGPEPDNVHLTGFILRLNDDGSTPNDNPFYNVATNLTGEPAANIKKVYAYGVRNGFGMAFDPLSGSLWTQENGDDAFDEMNRVTAGFDGGWVQVIGPLSRIAQFKQIESTYGAGNLQQLRWPPSLIADTPQEAMSRLYALPGSHYSDPEFSWKYAVAPSPLGFVKGRGLGAQFEGNMFVGAARTFLSGGYLFRFRLTPDRLHFLFGDSRLNDLVADNLDKFDLSESESLLIGRNFGITTDVETAPNGNLFIVSNTDGAVYEVSGTQPTLFVANLNGGQETPPNSSTGTGTATVLLSADETTARVSLNFSGLSSPETAAHIHGPAAAGVSAPILFPLPNGNFSDFVISLTAADAQNLRNGLLYVNVHSNNFAAGEIRGQFQTSSSASSFQFNSASYSVGESGGAAVITVTRLGVTSTPATVDYQTSDGTASNRTDYITTSGTLQFAAGETMKTFSVPIVDDLYVEASETINLLLTNPGGGAFLGSPNTASVGIFDNDTLAPTTNPLDDAQFFVRQQYLDFLNREPDPGGLAYWTNEITRCGADAACINARRVAVSAAFFIEAEFQQTGSFVYRLYRGTLGRDPTYAEFSADRSKLIVGPDLALNKRMLVLEFMSRAEFATRYPDGSDIIAALVETARNASGADLTGLESQLRQSYSNCLVSNPPLVCKELVVEDLINSAMFSQAVYNRAFVSMQYFGYLRRDIDSGGYAFWLDILTNRATNNYLAMVCAFITSHEYQERFSPVVTRNNGHCAGIQ